MNFHPPRTQWVAYINENYIDSYSCSPPRNISKYIMKRIGHCLYSEYKIQGMTSEKDSCCASFCLHTIYIAKVLGLDYKSAGLKLYYQLSS